MSRFSLDKDQFLALAVDSRELDRRLGFRVEETEAELLERARKLRPDGHLWSLGQGLHAGNQTWLGLDPQMLQTPYAEMIEMFEIVQLKRGDRVVDLGAGYGRIGVFLHRLNESFQFTGYEIVAERVSEGNRIYRELGIHASLMVKDLMDGDFVLPEAEIYFLYDFGEPAHIRTMMKQIEKQSHRKFVLIARGKGSRAIVDLEHPWLSDVHEVIRRENFAVYRS